MAIGTGTVVGGLLSGAASVIGGNKAGDEAREARYAAAAQSAEAMKRYDEAAQRLKDLGIPDAEAQRIMLESPELVGLQDIHELGPSAMGDVSTDPRLAQAQMSALESMQGMAGGMSPSEKAEAMMLTRGSAAGEQARQKAILQSMEERGVGGSGMELASRLGSSQAAAERDAMAKAALSASSQERSLQALSQAGQLGGQIRGQEFGEESQKASAADRIAAFNVAQRTNVEGANLARQQDIENQRVAAAQQQEIHNKALQQQEYQNKLAKEQSVAAALAGQGQAGVQQASGTLAAGQAAAAGQIAKGSALAGIAGAAGKAYDTFTSDKLKIASTGTENISVPGKADGGVVYGTEVPILPESPREMTRFSYAEGGVVYGTEVPVLPESPREMTRFSYEDGGMVMPPRNPIPESRPAPNINAGYADGGAAYDDYEEGDIVPGEEYEGDRIDAKVNAGEMVINLEQQQRLMELLKGLREPEDLGSEDIVEPSPELNASPDLGTDQYGGEGTRAPEPVSVGITSADSTDIPSSEELYMADGGVVRGLNSQHQFEKNKADMMKDAQKNNNARIKALETLMGK